MIILGIGDYNISNNKSETIKTYSLGSCVALTIHCPVKQITGMAHIALPCSINEDSSSHPPAYFADQAIPLMLNEFRYKYGVLQKNLNVGIYGGASSLRKNDVFEIGAKNVRWIKEAILKQGIKILKEDTGGHFSRTIEIDVKTGNVKVDSHPIII